MPWYKIDLSYGPGHQGHEVKYEYSSEVLSKEMEREMVNEVIDRVPWIRDSDNSVCWECNKVRRLPAKIRREHVDHYKSVIRGAEAMLKILGEK